MANEDEGWLTNHLKNRKFKYMFYTELFFEMILCHLEVLSENIDAFKQKIIEKIDKCEWIK